MNFHLEHHIAELLYRSIRGELSDFERQELNQWRSDSPMHETLFMRLQDDEYIDEELGVFIKSEEKNSVLWGRIRENSILRKKKRFIRFSCWGAAAVLLLVICVSLFIKEGEQEVVPVAIQTILPGSHKATLLTENGEEIELSDSVRMSIEQGVIASNNQLEYGDSIKELASGYYHVLKIPRGGEYRLKLSDGTIVYLNSDSELRYPVSFCATSREVELRGEAFFEVTKQEGKPFIVKTSLGNITVLGTQFNVCNYPGKEKLVTTLVQGKVSCDLPDGKSIILAPDQQLSVNGNGESKLRTVDTKYFTCWKDGMFLFEEMRMEDILEQLSRWYDIHIFYTNEEVKDLHFSGDLSRFKDIITFIEMFEKSADVKLTLKGNTLTVGL